MHRAGVVAAWCVWTAIGTTPASAQPLARVEIAWDTPESCPPTGQVLAEAERLLGPSYQGAGELDVEIAIAQVGDAYELRLEIEGETTEGERQLRMGSCQEVRDAAALLIALSLDPELATRAPEPEPEPEPAPEPEPETPARPPELELELPVVGADSSLLPSPAASLGIGVALRLSPLRLALGVAYLIPNAVEVRVNRTNTRFDVDVDALVARASLCWEVIDAAPWVLGPCGGLQLLRMSATPDVADGSPTRATVLAPELTVAGAYRVTPLVTIRLNAGAVIPPKPPRFRIRDNTPVHEVSHLSVQAELVLVFRYGFGG